MAQPRGPGGRRFVPPGERKAKDPRKTIGRLLAYMNGQYRLYLLLVMLCLLVTAFSSVAGSMFLKTLVDDNILPLIGTENPVFSGLARSIQVMAVIYVAGIIASYASSRLMATVAQGVQRNIRDQMFSHMQKLPLSYFDTNTVGDIMSHFTNDIDTLRQMLSQSIPQLLSSALVIVFTFVAMLTTSIPLTCIVVLMLFLIFYLVKNIGGQSGRYFGAQQAALGKLNGYIEEMTNGQKVVKVFCHEDAAKRDFDRMNEELREVASKANSYANIMMPMLMQLGNVQYVLLAIIGGLLAINGITGLTLGGIVAFLQLSRSFNQPIGQVSSQFNSIVMAMAGADRIFALLDREPEVDEGTVTLVRARYNEADDRWTEEPESAEAVWAWKSPQEDGAAQYTRMRGDVRLSRVNFGYMPDKLVLHDITLYAKPGQKVALVGATGAGKTTISNLLNRFYDINDGEILYDGINVRSVKKADLRRSLGVVLQDTHLFTGTIMENIRYGRLNATDEDVYAAAKLANAHDFITRLPNGYETMLTDDGADLSQGQRQLLAIARAAVADPPAMILDEATSSIDTRTEFLVQQGMDSLMQGRTVFVIAHRLSTIRNANVIMVMDFGKIIERGDHGELMAQQKRYYDLYQGGLELE